MPALPGRGQHRYRWKARLGAGSAFRAAWMEEGVGRVLLVEEEEEACGGDEDGCRAQVVGDDGLIWVGSGAFGNLGR